LLPSIEKQKEGSEERQTLKNYRIGYTSCK